MRRSPETNSGTCRSVGALYWHPLRPQVCNPSVLRSRPGVPCPNHLSVLQNLRSYLFGNCLFYDITDFSVAGKNTIFVR